MKQQTAIEWLLNEFQEAHKDFGGLDLQWLKKFEKAKEILSQDRPFHNWGSNVAKVWQGYFNHWDYMEKLFKDQQNGLNDGKELYQFMHKIQDESR